jgi:hypothetical protein
VLDTVQYICLPDVPIVLPDAIATEMLMDSWAQVVVEVMDVREHGFDPLILTRSIELCTP